MTATATALTAAPVAMAAAHVNAKSRKNCRVVTLSLGFMTPTRLGTAPLEQAIPALQW